MILKIYFTYTLIDKQHIVKQIVFFFFTPIGIPVNTPDDWSFFGIRKYSDTKKIIIFFQIKCSDSKKNNYFNLSEYLG